jgi:hypothetical protein
MSEERERIRVYEVSRRMSEIMHYLWDPIGVAGVAQARDEYDSYVPAVTEMVMHGEKKERIASYLTDIRAGAMALPDSPDTSARDLEIAALLIEHFKVIDAVYERSR